MKVPVKQKQKKHFSSKQY